MQHVPDIDMKRLAGVAAASHRPRALIIADSLALPREGVAFEHTWPALLAERLPHVTWINRAQRQSTTARLNGEGNQGRDCLDFFSPDLVLIQLGICDCAPRVLHPRTAAIVYRLPWQLGGRLSSWLERRRGRKASNCHVPPAAYEANLRRFLERAAQAGTHVVALAIAPATLLMTSKNPGTAPQIEAYNRILQALMKEHSHFSVVDPFAAAPDLDSLFVDGYHLNEAGNRQLCAALVKHLDRWLTSVRAG